MSARQIEIIIAAIAMVAAAITAAAAVHLGYFKNYSLSNPTTFGKPTSTPISPGNGTTPVQPSSQPAATQFPVVSPIPSALETPVPTPSDSNSPTPILSQPSPTQTTPIAVTPSPTSATSSPTTLLNLKCVSATPGLDEPLIGRTEAQNIAIGSEISTEIAYLRNQKDYINNSPYSEVRFSAITCPLDSKFRQFDLIMGIDSSHRYASKNPKLIVDIYLDNKLAKKTTVNLGSKENVSIDVSQARSLGIRAYCEGANYCPPLSFLQTSLK